MKPTSVIRWSVCCIVATVWTGSICMAMAADEVPGTAEKSARDEASNGQKRADEAQRAKLAEDRAKQEAALERKRRELEDEKQRLDAARSADRDEQKRRELERELAALDMVREARQVERSWAAGDPESAKAAARASAERLKEAQMRLEKTQRDVSDLRQLLRNSTGRMEVSPQGLERAISELDKERETLRYEAAGAEARRFIIEKIIAEQTDRGAVASAKDPVVTELEKIVEIRQKQLAMVEQLYKNKTIALADVDNAQLAVAESRAKLAERRREVVTTIGGETLTSLNRELINLTISEVERKARLDFLQSRLSKIEPVLGRVDDLQRNVDAVRPAQEEVRSAEREYRAWEAWFQIHKPKTQPAAKPDPNASKSP